MVTHRPDLDKFMPDIPHNQQGVDSNTFEIRNPNFESEARMLFASQGIMRLLGATMRVIEPGHCIIDLPFSDNLTQQDGFFHGGATTTIADSAGGFAAFTLMPANSRILTVEFKINLTAPARGDRLTAEARVIKPGKTLTISTIDVTAHSDSKQSLCAVMQQTAICIT